MGNMEMSDSSEPTNPRAVFDADDLEVERLIATGSPVRGHIEWQRGERTPFEARVTRWSLDVSFGKWELPALAPADDSPPLIFELPSEQSWHS